MNTSCVDNERKVEVCETILNDEINGFVDNEINDLLVDSLVDDIHDRVIQYLITDLVSINAEERSIIKQNLQESAINSIFDTYLTNLVTVECEKAAEECLERNRILEKIAVDEIESLFYSVTKHFTDDFIHKQKFVENYSKEYVDQLLNGFIETVFKEFLQNCKNMKSNNDVLVKYIFENIFDNIIKNEIEELVNIVYVNELKNRRQSKDINFIFRSVQLRPFIEPLEDLTENSIQEYSMLEDVTTAAVETFVLSSEESETEVEELPKTFPHKIKSQFSDAVTLKQTSTNRQNSSSIDTFKGQQKLLTKIKKSESTTQITTFTNTAELSAIIREKKKILDAEINNRAQQSSTSIGRQVEHGTRLQEDKRIKPNLKRSFEDARIEDESTPIKSEVCISPPAKRRHISPSSLLQKSLQGVTKCAINSTAGNIYENFSPRICSQQKGYISHALADYFKAFNVKKGFTLERLEATIKKFISPKSEFSVDLFVIMLIKVNYKILFKMRNVLIIMFKILF